MRTFLLLIALLPVGCRGPAPGTVESPLAPRVDTGGAAEPEERPAVALCTLGAPDLECAVRLEPGLAARATGLQLRLQWQDGALRLESVEAAPGVVVASRPALPEATGAVTLILYRAGEPAPLATDGVAARLRFARLPGVSSPVSVTADPMVATDARAERIGVHLGAEGVVEVDR